VNHLFQNCDTVVPTNLSRWAAAVVGVVSLVVSELVEPPVHWQAEERTTLWVAEEQCGLSALMVVRAVGS